MAGTCNSIAPHVFGSTSVELSRSGGRTGAPVSLRISTKSHGGIGLSAAATCNDEAPSCIYVGPLETANKETLEALYRQAREAYYSGKPLIVDDMFDRVEMKLRWYGSKSVVKYPRCSIRRQSTYSDAEDDLSQVFALASIWILIFAFGSSICLVPIICTIGLAFQDTLGPATSIGSQANVLTFLASVNGILFTVLGSIIGYPVASSSVRVLQGLWTKELVALKGACPNCGEEQSNSRLGRQWVYGRIYLLSRRGRNRYQR